MKMSNVYNFTSVDIPNKCPVCLKIFSAKIGFVTPFFLFFNGKEYAYINLCYNCAEILLKKVQEINPTIIAD
jgi:hypothetical protein